MFDEDELLPLSALQHLLFCERQCALIHVEGLWAENRLTVEGAHLHRKVDEGRAESRARSKVARSVPLRSLRLGLIGKADTVEYRRAERPTLGRADVRASEAESTPFPVEYKRGRKKPDRSDEVQLCAQAICLEEMTGAAVPAGALFYAQIRRRVEVEFDHTLRRQTEEAARRLHELVSRGITPRARREPKCDGCSLLHLCLPDAVAAGRSAAAFLARSLRELEPLEASSAQSAGMAPEATG